MSTYSGRHGPNVSQYLTDLNAISPKDATVDDPFKLDDDLALFTNTQFFDFDSGQKLDFQAQPVKAKAEPHPADDVTPPVMPDMPALDLFAGEFTFADFPPFADPPMAPFSDGVQSFRLQPSPVPVVALQPPSHFPQTNPGTADRLTSDPMPTVGTRSSSLEEASRFAAEEDKRRRNTAASARFRIKKKQREQALEKSAKEMAEKITALEAKVSQLETENKWLKNLLVEKNEGSDDITALWKDFTKHASEKTAKASVSTSSSSSSTTSSSLGVSPSSADAATHTDVKPEPR